MIHINKEKIVQFSKFSFPLILFFIAIFELSKFIGTLDIHLLRLEMEKLHFIDFFLILVISLFAISPMLFYDVMLVKILGLNVPRYKLLKQSFITNSFSNLIGFGGLIGVVLRTSFYNNYNSEKRPLLKGIASVTLFFLTGLSLLSWIIPILYRDFPLLSESKWLFFAVLGMGLYLPIFTFFHLYQHKKGIPTFIRFRSGVCLLAVSVLEWLCVFLVIASLSITLNIPLAFSDLFPVFIIAACAGMISMIPGGLGSFDLVFIWGTQNLMVSNEKVLALLIFYRIGYFFIPFIISTVLFIKEYWEKWNHSWNDLPNIMIQKISHALLTVMIFLSGLLLLLSTSVPGIIGRLKLAQEFLSSPIMNLSHQLAVAAGFLLLGLSRGIEYSVKWAYHISIVVLSFAAIFSLFKGIDYEEAIFLVIVALLLRIAKKQFYRENYVITWGKSIFDITLIIIITSIYLFIGYLNLPTAKINVPAKFMPYIIMDSHDLFYSAIIGLGIAFLILFISYLISKPLKWGIEPSINKEEEILSHLNKYHGNILAHLIFLHDKYLHWNQKKNVIFSYQKYADKIIVLGDPIGEKDDIQNAIDEFSEIADLHGYAPVYYQVSKAMLPTFHENGYDFFKLGEVGFVDLERFTLSGQKMKNARALKNKFERENIHFEMVQPPFKNDFIKELEQVSLQWLNGRKEKGFSLGFFDENYLNKAEIAIVRENGNRIIGFANVMPVYDENQTISVDMMRFSSTAPPGTMDFIFLSLFTWAQQQGYKRFNIGMAPLSNVGSSKFSFLSEKIASQIFAHGQFFYHFQGLRKFKEKYADSWEPKYLAYRRKSSLLFTMMKITLLIGRKRGE